GEMLCSKPLAQGHNALSHVIQPAIKVSRGPGAPELRQGACLSSVREVGGVGVVRRDLLQPGNSIHTSPAFISSSGCVRALSHWRWLGAKLFSQGPMNARK
ncbi:hypothetical protein KUCAC02_006368, partial [Chaenocephalus aceratus]